MFTLDAEAWKFKRANLIAMGCKVKMSGKRGNRRLRIDSSGLTSNHHAYFVFTLTSLVVDYGWKHYDSYGSILRYRES